MNAKSVLKGLFDFNHQVLNAYLSDLSDADLLVRPAPNANHIAWQLGHLINSEAQLLANVPGASFPELPAGFADQHSKARSATESAQGFKSKADYLDLYGKVRAASLALLEKLPEAELDKPNTGAMKEIAPTVGAQFMLAANHELMHAGQFVVVRRKLGKPVLM